MIPSRTVLNVAALEGKVPIADGAATRFIDWIGVGGGMGLGFLGVGTGARGFDWRCPAAHALFALSVACWPGPPLLGMSIYSAALTLYLASLGLSGGSSGILLWPAMLPHLILTALLALASVRDTGHSAERK